MVMYFLEFLRDNKTDYHSLTILKERYAKGEISEEDYLKMKKDLEMDYEKEHDSSAKYFLGITFIVVGAFFFLNNIMFFDINIPWPPILLIGFGIFWIYRNRK